MSNSNWEQIENKLGTNYRRTPVNQADQHIRKSLRSKDGLVFYPAHNPKVVSSNLTPATISKTCLKIGLRGELVPCFLAQFAQLKSQTSPLTPFATINRRLTSSVNTTLRLPVTYLHVLNWITSA
jgi:hypothetical protein